MMAGNAEIISGAITHWLHQEIVNADEGRNAYLSEYEDRRNDLFKQFDDPNNSQSSKAISHYSRLSHWLTDYSDLDRRTDDWFIGRIIFACLMNVAGGYRKQCFFEAKNTADYLSRRHENSAGIDVVSVVGEELESDNTAALNAMSDDERIDYITGRSLATNDASLSLHRSAHIWVISHPANRPLAAPDDEPVVAMQEVQRLWTGLAAGHIVVAATLRSNDYSKVPFLEPKSISDANTVIYPLAS